MNIKEFLKSKKEKKIRKNIKEFLKFEKRKMIFPCFLVLLFVLFVFSIADNSYTRHSEEMTDIAFKLLKAYGFQAGYRHFNETEKADEINKTIERLLKENEMIMKKIETEAGPKEYIVSAGSVILGPLGLNLCHMKNIPLPFMTCPFWNSDIFYAVHDLLCLTAGYIAEVSKLNFTEEGSREMFEQFIIDHPLDRTEKCEEYEKLYESEWEAGKTKQIFSEIEKTNMIIAGAFAAGYIILFFVEGYLISCAIFFVWDYFRKKKSEGLIKKK